MKRSAFRSIQLLALLLLASVTTPAAVAVSADGSVTIFHYSDLYHTFEPIMLSHRGGSTAAALSRLAAARTHLQLQLKTTAPSARDTLRPLIDLLFQTEQEIRAGQTPKPAVLEDRFNACHLVLTQHLRAIGAIPVPKSSPPAPKPAPEPAKEKADPDADT